MNIEDLDMDEYIEWWKGIHQFDVGKYDPDRLEKVNERIEANCDMILDATPYTIVQLPISGDFYEVQPDGSWKSVTQHYAAQAGGV